MKSLRVAQINILNSKNGLEERLEVLKESIIKREIDVVTMQEIIDQSYTAEALADAGLTYSFFSDTKTNLYGDSDCSAVFSKYPIVHGKSYDFSAGRKEAQTRPFCHATIDVEQSLVNVFSAHFPWGSHNEFERLKTADNIDTIAEDMRKAGFTGPIILGADTNSDVDSRASRFLHGKDLGPDNMKSTYWTDAYDVFGNESNWATSDQSKSNWGADTLKKHNVYIPELIPPRRIDLIMSYGWTYGKIGSPLSFYRFGEPEQENGSHLSDHYAIASDFLIEW